jgi:hypothetical protein
MLGLETGGTQNVGFYLAPQVQSNPMGDRQLSLTEISKAIHLAWEEQMEAIRNTRPILELRDQIALDQETEDLLWLKRRLRDHLGLPTQCLGPDIEKD